MSTLARHCKRWLSLRAYGAYTRTLFRPGTPPERMRTRFARFGTVSRQAMQRKHPAVRFADHAVGALPIESVCAVAEPRCAILHLHGGAFVMGSPAVYRNRAMRLSFRCEAEVFVPDYRLAPEHPYPAALEDALVAYQYLRALRPGMPVIVTGDSAGGGLALSLMVWLRELGEPQPEAAVLLSPWTDLSGSGESVAKNHGKDLWLSRAHLDRWAQHYAAGAELRTPKLSPVFAELHALPPLLAVVGEDEIVLDDSRRVVEGAQRAGGDARLLVGRGMQHDFPLTLPWLDESRRAWREIASFVAEHTGAARVARSREPASRDLANHELSRALPASQVRT